ncbi:hypothetical protein BJY52DRAFT_1308609 [Lactarius psammicola]|nr:hypothetical protein BJY52DRAFT_1308609 [Lactarius psammicola]
MRPLYNGRSFLMLCFSLIPLLYKTMLCCAEAIVFPCSGWRNIGSGILGAPPSNSRLSSCFAVVQSGSSQTAGHRKYRAFILVYCDITILPRQYSGHLTGLAPPAGQSTVCDEDKRTHYTRVL